MKEVEADNAEYQARLKELSAVYSGMTRHFMRCAYVLCRRE